MKRWIFPIFVFLLILVSACQQKQTVQSVESPKSVTTGEAAVDDVGNGLSNVDNDEKELNADELSELDSGFEDVQNI